jgi:hypothetical protein
MGPTERERLRAAMRARYGWLDEPDLGPRAVDAGECPRCGAEAALVPTCGPVAWQALGRRCAQEIGVAAWCDGHADEAARALAWLAGLPGNADHVARLWWVATGEVRLDPALLDRTRILALGE